MAATASARRTFDERWLLERKLDGVRCIGRVADGEVQLTSRTGHSYDAAFPEVRAALARAVTDDLVVDGEIVAMDGDRTSFAKLQPRLGADGSVGRPTPVVLHLFDLLWFAGHDLRMLPLVERKATLLEVVAFDEVVQPTGHVEGYGTVDLTPLCRAGWEGLIAKRAASTYQPRRSRDWLKLKCTVEQELVVVGFTAPGGSRTGFGSLLLAVHDEAGLRFAGKVGTGFDDATLAALRLELDASVIDQRPTIDEVDEPDARWVAPHLVVQVAFDSWTEGGRLRHPRFVGVRRDKDPTQVVREPLG